MILGAFGRSESLIGASTFYLEKFFIVISESMTTNTYTSFLVILSKINSKNKKYHERPKINSEKKQKQPESKFTSRRAKRIMFAKLIDTVV